MEFWEMIRKKKKGKSKNKFYPISLGKFWDKNVKERK